MSDGWIVPGGAGSLNGVTRYHSIDRPAALRRRRRRYARAVWRHRVGAVLTLPVRIRLPAGRLLERRNHLFWRVRLPLWAVPGVTGALVAGWPGVAVGFAGAVLAELLFSYHRPGGPTGTATPA